MLPQEVDLGPLSDPSSMLWISGILISLPIVLMVVIAIAIAHGHRVRKKAEDDS